jgi:hypothetical protein
LNQREAIGDKYDLGVALLLRQANNSLRFKGLSMFRRHDTLHLMATYNNTRSCAIPNNHTTTHLTHSLKDRTISIKKKHTRGGGVQLEGALVP